MTSTFDGCNLIYFGLKILSAAVQRILSKARKYGYSAPSGKCERDRAKISLRNEGYICVSVGQYRSRALLVCLSRITASGVF